MRKIILILCCLLAIIFLPFHAESVTAENDFWQAEAADQQPDNTDQEYIRELVGDLLPGAIPLCQAVGWDNLYWWLEDENGSLVIDRLPVALHELCHEYSCISQNISYERFKQGETAKISYKKRLQAYDYYYGNGRSVKIIFTELLPTSCLNITELDINDNLSQRYLDSRAGAEIYGIYGLLNEFNAYSWQAAMRRALADNDLGSFNRQFYREYYDGFISLIERWLAYAAANRPDIYHAVCAEPAVTLVYDAARERFSKALFE